MHMEPPITKSYPFYSLANSIFLLASAKPEELPKTFDEIAPFLAREVDPAYRIHYLGQLRLLALQSVEKPIIESLREGISNACDAQIIANNKMAPVLVELQGRVCRIIDQGTGLAYVHLRRLFVDGDTSNPNEILSPGKGIANVAGRLVRVSNRFFTTLSIFGKKNLRRSSLRALKGIWKFKFLSYSMTKPIDSFSVNVQENRWRFCP